MHIYCQENLKLNQLYATSGVPEYNFLEKKFQEIKYNQTPKRLHFVSEVPTPTKIVIVFFRYNELSRKIFTVTVEVCEQLRKVKSWKCKWNVEQHISAPV